MGTGVKVPTLGESITEATLGQWLKKPGEAVAVPHNLAGVGALLTFVLQRHAVTGIARLGDVLPPRAEGGSMRGRLCEPRGKTHRQITRRPVVPPHLSKVSPDRRLGEFLTWIRCPRQGTHVRPVQS